MELLRSNRTSLMLYLLITVFVIALFVDGNPTFEKFEQAVQDSMFGFRGARAPSGDVVICALDDQSVDELGWPLKREKLGHLYRALREAGASAIVSDFDWRNVALPDSARSDSILLAALSGPDRVILPLSFTYADLGVNVPAPPAAYLGAAWTERFPHGSAVAAQALTGPDGFLADSASALGGITPMLDRDRVVRWAPLLVDYGGHPFASSVLWAVSLHLNVGRTNWWLSKGAAVKVGDLVIPTDDRGRLLLNFLGPERSFTHHSARAFLRPESAPPSVRGKIVVVGPTGVRGGVYLPTRTSDECPAVELTATAIENIIHRQFVRTPSYSVLFDLLALGLIGLFCAVVLPQISLSFRFVVLGISLFVIVNMQYLLFASFGWLTHAFYPAIEIVFFMAVSPLMQAREEPQTRDPRSKRRDDRSAPPAYTDAHHPTTEPHTIKERTEAAPQVGGQPTAFQSEAQQEGAPGQDTARLTGHSAKMPTVLIPAGASSADTTATPQTGVPVPPAAEATPRPPIATGKIDLPPVEEGSGVQFLGRYQLVEEIGRGAMGVVYKGIDPAINRPVALKTVRLDLAVPPAEKEELRSRLLREAQAAGQLSHPNIVTIYDVGSQGDIHYIAMEYLKGYTLERAVQKRMTLNYKIFAKLLIQVCDALEYAHSNDLVHRDIKPANIMVLDNFKVKVMDFGIARIAHSNMTQTGVALGTPSYISPEQLSGHGVDRRSDIFSLGVVIYELLTKEKPFAGESINKLIFSILNEKPRRPTELDGNIPEAFNQICAKALEKEPAKRYPYAADLARDLKEFIASLQPQKLGI